MMDDFIDKLSWNDLYYQKKMVYKPEDNSHFTFVINGID